MIESFVWFYTVAWVVAFIAAAVLERKPQILARREEKQLSERELDALYARETADGVLEKMVAEAERQAERDFYGLEDEPLRRRPRFGVAPNRPEPILRAENLYVTAARLRKVAEWKAATQEAERKWERQRLAVIERNRNTPADAMSAGWRLREEKENGTRPDRLQAAPDRPRAIAGGEGTAEPVHPF